MNFIPFHPQAFSEGWTQSELTLLDQCPYKWYLRYGLLLSPRNEFNMPLAFGSAWHESLEVWYKSKGENEHFALLQISKDIIMTLELQRDIEFWQEVLTRMLVSYYYHYKRDHKIFKIQAVESIEQVEVEVLGQRIKLKGILDLVGNDFATDHKTTSMLNLSITEGWDFKFQFFFYAWLAWKSKGKRIKCFYVNAIKKPQIRLKQGESVGAFGSRLLADMTARFSNYFYRQEVELDGQRLENFEENILLPKLERVALLQDPKTNLPTLQALSQNKNTDACHNFNHRCEYYAICSRHDTSFEDEVVNFQTRTQKHTEYDNE